MAKKKKWYGVRTGYKTGVFETWDECKLQVDGFKGAAFRAFDSQQEALDFANTPTSVTSAPHVTDISSTHAAAGAGSFTMSRFELTGQSAVDFIKTKRQADGAPLQQLTPSSNPSSPSCVALDGEVSRVPSLTEGIGARLLRQAGWSGGGLGARGLGIINPINPVVPSGRRSGLGSLDPGAQLSVEELASPRLSPYCDGSCTKLGFCNCEPPSPIAQPAPPLPPHLQPPLLHLNLSDDQRTFLELAESGCNIFLTGLGGTGKSHVLKLAVKILRLKWGGGDRKIGRSAVALASSTGVSAVSIGGVTLHSLAGCGVPRHAVHFERTWSRKSLWKNMRVH
jgi:hypothetical protein